MGEHELIHGPLSEEQIRSLAFMYRPERWPWMHLPLKRDRDGGLDAAYMYWLDAEYAVMVEGNMFETDVQARRNAPRLRLRREQLGQIVLRGWRVD